MPTTEDLDSEILEQEYLERGRKSYNYLLDKDPSELLEEYAEKLGVALPAEFRDEDFRQNIDSRQDENWEDYRYALEIVSRMPGLEDDG
ncbi:MAG: hypothetical protein ABEJ66_01630 [Candidatus Nanohaloarchaea archaeon]